MNTQEEQIQKQLVILKGFETTQKQELLKRVEGNSKSYLQGLEENYKDFMYLNALFGGNDRAIDQIIREVYPSMKCKNKNDEKKFLRAIGKVFVQELAQLSIQAKQDMGREVLDVDCVTEGYRRYEQTHAPIRKNSGRRRLI